MSEPIRIGVLGLTHDHVWSNVDELVAHPRGDLIAVADPNKPLLDKAHQRYDCTTYSDFESLLDREQLDAVYVYSDNRTSVGLAIAAASRNLHVLMEKPLANTLANADRLLAAVSQHNGRFMVNWPFAWWPQLQQALSMIQSGAVGRVWQVKYRAAHEGPKEMGCSEYFSDWLFDAERNGGGALIDYCCYGALLARVILGMPDSVTGVADRLCKDDIQVEDNAVLIIKYLQAIAIAEASWTQIGKFSSYIPMIYGTKGSLMVEPRAGGRLFMADQHHPDAVEVPISSSPAEMKSASAHFLHCLETGRDFTPLCRATVARDAQAILEMGQRSATEGRTVMTAAVEQTASGP